MQQSFSLPLFLAFLVGSSAQFTPVSAQVTPDGSTSTTVNVDDNKVEINDGNRAGGNLFHSFREFSIPTGGEASFNNPDTIENIFSRVTGGNISSIDGLIRTNDASLFLINPAGIIFGAGARLDLGGGSFYGSSADSILFEDGEFSAADLDNPPLITINAPIGLSFRDNPGELQIQGSSLEVQPNRTLALVGGDLVFAGGNIQVSFFPINIDGELSLPGGNLLAPEGRIELGSVGGQNVVSLQSTAFGWQLGYEDVQNFGDIELTEGAVINASGTAGGSIQVRGSQVSLLDGSRIVSLTLGSQPGGDFTLNANKLVLEDEAGISTTTFSQGQGGDLIIQASESVELIGVDSQFATGLFAESAELGNSGNLTIDTGKFIARNGGYASTSSFGEGRAGNINLDAVELMELIGTGIIGERVVSSGLFSFTVGSQESGNMNINTSQLFLRDGAQISNVTFGSGNSGNLTVNASESVEIIGVSSNNVFSSRLDSTTANEGDAGEITVNTKRLILQDGGQISVSSFFNGNSGNLTVNASESVEIIGNEPIGRFSLVSGIFAQTLNNNGNGGNIEINTPTFSLTDGGLVLARTSSTGNSGDINLNAEDSIFLSGTDGGLFSNATEEAIGNSGSIFVDTSSLTISDGAAIATNNQGQGSSGGIVSVTAKDLTLNSEASISAFTTSGEGGQLSLTIDNSLTLENNSQITAQAFETANGGNIDIDTNFIIAFPNGNNDIVASAEQGNGGNIDINAEALFGIEERPLNPITNDINASSELGLEGSVSINTPDVNALETDIDLPNNPIANEQSVAQACRSDLASGKVNGLVVKGKGGIPPEPTAPMDSDTILVNGKIMNLHPQVQSLDIKPVKTSIGDIYPARGIMVSELGEIILTAFPTDSIDRRTPQIKANCIH